MPQTIDKQIVEGLLDVGVSRFQALVQATANSTLTLNVASVGHMIFTGSTVGQIVKLGVATTYQVGHTYLIHNNSSVTITVQDSAGTTITTLPAGNRVHLILQDASTAIGIWSYELTSTSLSIPIFTNGSMIFAGAAGALAENNAKLFWDDTNHYLGIGTNTPLAPLHFVGTTGQGNVLLETYVGISTSGFTQRTARGTPASPSAVLSGDILGGMSGRGYGATAWAASGSTQIAIIASENWTDTAQGSYYSVKTTLNGTNTAVERMRIYDHGQLQLGIPGSTALSNNIFSIANTVDAFFQANIQNTSTGTLASSDWIATADDGNDTNFYINMGINGSRNADPSFTVSGAHDGYLYVNGGDLALGASSATKVIRFFLGGTLAADEKVQISANGNLLIGLTTDNALDKIQIPRGSSVSFPMMEMFDDFLWTTLGSGTNPYSVVSAVSGAGASITVETTTTSNDDLGMITASTGTAANGHAVIDFFSSVNKIRLGGRRIIFEARAQIPTLSVAAQTFTAYTGLQDGNAIGVPANGIFFSYTHGTNSGQWVCTCRSGSTSTVINSAVTVTAAQWYALRAEINAARTTVDFYIDGVLIGTNSASNIPAATAGMRPLFQIDKSVGTTARTLLADYMYLKMFR